MLGGAVTVGADSRRLGAADCDTDDEAVVADGVAGAVDGAKLAGARTVRESKHELVCSGGHARTEATRGFNGGLGNGWAAAGCLHSGSAQMLRI